MCLLAQCVDVFVVAQVYTLNYSCYFRHIAAEATIRTDSAKAYPKIVNTYTLKEWNQKAVNHTYLQQNFLYKFFITITIYNFIDPNDPTVHTQTVDGLIGRVKLYFRNMHGTTKYLNYIHMHKELFDLN